MSFLNNAGVTTLWTRFKGYLTGAHVTTSVISGANNVDTALSSLATSVSNLETGASSIAGRVSTLETGTSGLATRVGILETGATRARRNITNDLSNLSTAIAEQDLAKYGYDFGDYFVGASGYVYTLADPDTFYGGYDNYAVISTHHITVVVDTKQNVQWNTSNDTSTGYVGSNLHAYMTGTVLNNVKSDIAALFGDWQSHLLKHSKLYSTAVSSWSWSADQYISALTSVQIHGSPVCDVDFYSTGEGNKPLLVFLKHFFAEILGNHTTWLRSIASASLPCYAAGAGDAGGGPGASLSRGAVGLIILV